MLKIVRNWTLAVLFFGACITGFLAPIIWPHLYMPFQSPIYGIPLVQHHVELCDSNLFKHVGYVQETPFCEPIEVDMLT